MIRRALLVAICTISPFAWGDEPLPCPTHQPFDKELRLVSVTKVGAPVNDSDPVVGTVPVRLCLDNSSDYYFTGSTVFLGTCAQSYQQGRWSLERDSEVSP